MNVNCAIQIIKSSVQNSSEQKEHLDQISDEMPLIGSDSVINSMQLVELCLLLEDKAEEMGFEFDWTSEIAMSKSRGMFRSVKALAQEFVRQYSEQK